MKNKISIIIPCYKEGKNIKETLEDLQRKGFEKSEIIIVDGSSDTDLKIEVKKFKNTKYISIKKSFRGATMNIGATTSSGDILLFLHADTFLPKKSLEILSLLNLEKSNYGGFCKQFSPNSFLLKIISSINNFQTKVFGKLLGDNAIFVSRELFFQIGRFSEIELMEDVEISKELKKYGKRKIIKDTLTTSSRKFQKSGVLKTILFMGYLRIIYFFGVETKTLEKKYRKI